MDLEDEFKMKVLDGLRGANIVNSKLFVMSRYPNLTRRLKRSDSISFYSAEIEKGVVEDKVVQGIDEYNELVREYKKARMEDKDGDVFIDRAISKCRKYSSSDKLKFDELAFLVKIGFC